MESYIKGNKEAWEEAFNQKDSSWGEDLVSRVRAEDYAFFNKDMVRTLKNYNLTGKCIGQFCCNNGRELLSLVKTTGAASGIGFDIAENQIAFANEKAKELNLPCEFVAENILDIGEEYKETFDAVIITIGALCWFKDLTEYFAVVSNCMKKDGVIIINEQHPFTNMVAMTDEPEYNVQAPKNCIHSYFEQEWTGNEGMYYMTKKNYVSKTFTDYTHSMADIIGAMCKNHIVVTGMQEFDYDISGGFEQLNGNEVPLSMIIEGRKESYRKKL